MNSLLKSFIVFSFILSLNAHALVCSDILSSEAQQISTDGLSDYEASRLAALSGDIKMSIRINQKIRKKISSMKIVEVLNGEHGTHGAYRAKLEDGTEVLIKPHSEDWYSSIPKEVGVSIFAEMIGVPLVPVAGFRLDPVTKAPASVHLIQKVDSLRRWWSGIRGFMVMIREQGHIVDTSERSKLFGNEISFLMGIVGYSYYEAQPRHVLNQTIRGEKIKSLIDLGSAFIDTVSRFDIESAPFIMLSEISMRRIESLDKEAFKESLSPYFPEAVIEALFLNTQNSVRVMRVYQGGNPVEMKRVNDLILEERPPYVSQKWNWRDALRPPQIAIEFGI